MPRIFVAFFWFVVPIAFNDTYQNSHIFEKEGRILYESVSILGTQSFSVYFDHYGKRRVINITDTNVVPHQNILIIELDTVKFTMFDTLQCIKQKREKNFSLSDIDFMYLDEKTKRDFGISLVGDTVFQKRKCLKY